MSDFRVIFDLQATQSNASRNRGVGNYSRNLCQYYSAIKENVDLHIILQDNKPYDAIKLVSENKILRLPNFPNPETERNFYGGESDTIDSQLYSAFYSELKPDILHLSHIFEGYSERIFFPNLDIVPKGQIISATVYDTIPFLFPEYYLSDPNVEKWYNFCVNYLKKIDLLLSISDSTRDDIISLFGINPDKIITIHGGVSASFCKKDAESLRPRSTCKKYNITRKFIFYTGGDDFRKNIDRLIEGYSKIPKGYINLYELVIACSIREERKKELLKLSKTFGLSEGTVKILGFIPEEDLVELYSLCDLFVFPSLYEGLGLPILEAMRCGAPVIGSNTSSIREIIENKEALFDPYSVDSIAESIYKSLSTPELLNSLKSYSVMRSKDFSWEKSSKKMSDAFSDAINSKRKSGIRAALSGWLEKKRLAVFTPLSPLKTGIAEYNELFLSYLSRFFNIDIFIDDYTPTCVDITSSFRIFSFKGFDHVANYYDAILYDVGNSEFHAYMIPLLYKYPGVVCLHDAYLSGLFGYLDFNMGQANYQIEMIESHGSVAREYFAPINSVVDSVFKSMVNLPCTWKIINASIGLISHSKYNLEKASIFYPNSWLAPYRIIPQAALLKKPLNQLEKTKIKESLGFSASDIIVSSFGHIAWTKMGDLIISSFIEKIVNRENIHLVFVGELSKDEFGKKITNMIENSKYREKIHITGFLNKQVFDSYLYITDISIQLRKNSRGGTPKGVLDCLSLGIPTIVNNEASYSDYTDDVLIKIPSSPTCEDISNSVILLLCNSGNKKPYFEKSRKYIYENHNPELCAANYASFIDECVSKEKIRTEINLQSMIPHTAFCRNINFLESNITTCLSLRKRANFLRRKIYVDVSYTAEKDSNTGIARVVKEIVKSIYLDTYYDIEGVAVVKDDTNKLKIASSWLFSRGLISKNEENKNEINDNSVSFSSGDILLMLDSSWGKYSEFIEIFESARKNNALIYTVIYDILPIKISECFVPGGREWFESWLRLAINESDGLICISKSVATDVSDYIRNANIRSIPRIDYWYLGANFEAQFDIESIKNEKIRHLKNKKYFLMFGTIEPRKRHELALKAMELLWKDNFEISLCIAGKHGWLMEDFIVLIKTYSKFTDKLYFIESPTDEESKSLYLNATATLFISKDEGFGLPIIESAHYGTPVICSDIPVFREIGGNHVSYIAISNEVDLAQNISEWWNKCKKYLIPDIKQVKFLSWAESAKMLVTKLIN